MALKFTSIIIILVTTFSIIPNAFSGSTTGIPPNKSQLGSWFETNVQPQTARKSTLDPKLAEAEASPPKIINVNKNGGGDFKTIGDAVKSIPTDNTKRVVIKIAGGVYTEKVKIEIAKPFVTLSGAPNDMPTLTYGGTAAQYGTVDSATLIVESDYFMANNIIFKNTAPNPDGKRVGAQALALRISGDKAAFYNCKFYGYQDTLCDDKGMHFYKNCFFEGTVDFIFGRARSIFLDTQINVIKSVFGMTCITAHARDSPAKDDGYIFVHGNVTGTTKGSLLGRIWLDSALVVFAYTNIDDILTPAGWSNNKKPDREKATVFAEYKNTGPGADPKARASFAKQLSPEQAQKYLNLDYIQASTWLLPPPKV